MLSLKEVHTMQKTTKDLNWQENEALARYILIAPMLDPALDAAKRSSLRREAAPQLRPVGTDYLPLSCRVWQEGV